MRCNIVTCAALVASAGASVTAVAPLPITTSACRGSRDPAATAGGARVCPESDRSRGSRQVAVVVAEVAGRGDQPAAGERCGPSGLSTVRVQSELWREKSAPRTWLLKRILPATCSSRAVASMYSRIAGPSAIAFSSVQGGTRNRRCAGPSPSGSRGSGTGPRCRRFAHAARGSGIAARDARARGSGQRRFPTGPHR